MQFKNPKIITNILLLFLSMQLLNAKTKSEQLLDKALKLTNVYSIIPLLDESLKLMDKKGEIKVYFTYAKVEVMLEMSKGFNADYIVLCDILKKANKLQSFHFPQVLGGKTSIEKEKEVCTKIQNYSGQQMFDYGVKMMTRTKDGISTTNSISHAMPYFKQAEQKNFHDPELYKTLSLIYNDKRKYKKALKYAKLFFKTNDKKGLYEADVMTIFALSKLQVDGISKQNIKAAINILKKSKLLGDKKASQFIETLTKALAKSNSSNMNCTRVSSDYALWKYCTNGDCSGFSLDYKLWKLCENNDYNAFSNNYGIWKYLKDGDTTGLSSNYKLFKSAEKNASSFLKRKKIIIYYLRGYMFRYY